MQKLILLAVFAALACAQAPIPVRGAGVPNNNTCNVPGQYGNLYFDTTTSSNIYSCGSSGWQLQGSTLNPQSITSTVVVTNTATGNSTTQTPFTDAGLSYFLGARDGFESKRVIAIGGSICAGVGASVYANSWMGLLTSTQSSYTFINSAISGNTTGNVISRFYTDVAPWHPDFVIVCNTTVNETGGGTPTQASVRTFLTNQHRIVKMIEGIGAIPIVAGPPPNNNWTTAGCGLIRDIYDAYETWGVQVWDLLDVAYDPASSNTCSYQSSLDFGDGIHPNDAGHAALFSAVSYSYLDIAVTQRVPRPAPIGIESYLYGTDTSTVPFGITPANAIVSAAANVPSWTWASWIKNQSGVGAKAFMYWGGSTGPLRVRNNTTIELIGTGIDINSSVDGTDGAWHHVAVTYNRPSNTACLYIDGALISSCSTGPTAFNATSFTLLGRTDSTVSNCVTCSLAMPALYRTNLPADAIKDLYSGRILKRSLEFYSNLGKPRTWTSNEAQTSMVGEPFSGTNGMTQGGAFVVIP